MSCYIDTEEKVIFFYEPLTVRNMLKQIKLLGENFLDYTIEIGEYDM